MMAGLGVGVGVFNDTGEEITAVAVSVDLATDKFFDANKLFSVIKIFKVAKISF